MKVIKGTVDVIDTCYVELELEDNEDLSRKEIEDMMYDELVEDLPSLKLLIDYDIKEV